MKKNLLKYIYVIIGFFVILVIYLSTLGIETKKLNGQIKDKIYQIDKNLEIELKKIRLTLDPLNFKIIIKTIGPEVFYKKKDLKLEYIKTQISIISFIKKKIVSSKLELSTKSILFKDLVSFLRTTTNKPELFILERSIKNGMVIANISLNFDEKGKIRKDYTITTSLKDGKIKLLRNYNFEKINFFLTVNNNTFNFKDVSFTSNNSNFVSKNLKIDKNEKNFYIEGDIQNKNSILNNELLKLLNIDYNNIKFLNTNFDSKSEFSLNVDNKFKIKNLVIKSNVQINNSEYQKPLTLDDYFHKENKTIQLKDHEIKSEYKNNKLIIEGQGKIKLEEKFDEIKYKINLKDKNLTVYSKLKLSELNIKRQEFLKFFFPEHDKKITLKNQQIEINYNKNALSIKGLGKIKFSNEYEDINFNVSKIQDKYKFETKIDLEKTALDINFFNFKKDNKLKTQIKILGSYNDKDAFDFNNISIIDKDNKIILSNILINRNNQIEKIDKINFDFFDKQNKKNKISLLRKEKNEYLIRGVSFNADKIIDYLLKSKENEKSKIFKNDFNLILDLNKVYFDDKNTINNLNGNLSIKDNKVFTADIIGVFNKDESIKFTINTSKIGEKITTLFTSRAKPIVSRYKFIQGYEEGYLDFYSTKKNNISKSKLKIYDFKLQKLPALTKLLTLASLQGIADTLSGEGIRFNEFEMNFTNKNSLMTINEIYAIGPAISILMDGYVEENKLISLRGTLVPATTINKSIGSIPFLGKILVGEKVGEGVFGVSFKIKGPPKKLETTVNPIKTLTPRFITRTLEKIKNN